MLLWNTKPTQDQDCHPWHFGEQSQSLRDCYQDSYQDSHLSEQLPQLLVLVDFKDVVSGEDWGSGHGEDVVHVQHQVGDVAEGEEAEHHLLTGGRGPEMWDIPQFWEEAAHGGWWVWVRDVTRPRHWLRRTQAGPEVSNIN